MNTTAPIHFLAKNFHHFTQNSTIYDLGIGNGRNAYFLAEKNFKIIGIDKDEELLQEISHSNISTICTDINGFLHENDDFENIIATFSLRFTGKNFLKNIATIQEKTKIGGINLIVDFIDDNSEFVQKGKNCDFYWLKNEELKNLYSKKNWEILDYIEEKTPTRIFGKNGEKLKCLSAYIIARKIV